jgi:hypothetical protein
VLRSSHHARTDRGDLRRARHLQRTSRPSSSRASASTTTAAGPRGRATSSPCSSPAARPPCPWPRTRSSTARAPRRSRSAPACSSRCGSACAGPSAARSAWCSPSPPAPRWSRYFVKQPEGHRQEGRPVQDADRRRAGQQFDEHPGRLARRQAHRQRIARSWWTASSSGSSPNATTPRDLERARERGCWRRRCWRPRWPGRAVTTTRPNQVGADPRSGGVLTSGRSRRASTTCRSRATCGAPPTGHPLLASFPAQAPLVAAYAVRGDRATSTAGASTARAYFRFDGALDPASACPIRPPPCDVGASLYLLETSDPTRRATASGPRPWCTSPPTGYTTTGPDVLAVLALPRLSAPRRPPPTRRWSPSRVRDVTRTIGSLRTRAWDQPCATAPRRRRGADRRVPWRRCGLRRGATASIALTPT